MDGKLDRTIGQVGSIEKQPVSDSFSDVVFSARQKQLVHT